MGSRGISGREPVKKLQTYPDTSRNRQGLILKLKQKHGIKRSKKLWGQGGGAKPI